MSEIEFTGGDEHCTVERCMRYNCIRHPSSVVSFELNGVEYYIELCADHADKFIRDCD